MRAYALTILASTFITLSTVSVARADDVTQKAMAESLFQEGLDLFDKGKTDDACDRFDKSQSLDPKLSTLMNLATCRERQGHTATAWEEFTEAATLAEKQKSPDRASQARDKASSLAGKLSKVRLTRAGDTPGMTLMLDSKPLAAGMVGESFPVDPGSHHIDVSATGYTTYSHDFTVPAGPAEVPVEIPALPKEAGTKVEPTVPTPPNGEEPTKDRVRPKHKSEGHTISPVAIASFAIGGASLLVGIGTGGASIAMTSSLKSTPCASKQHVCTSTNNSDISTANGLANASNVTFAVAGVGAVIGIIFTATSLSASSDQQAIEIVPTGDVGAGMRVHF